MSRPGVVGPLRVNRQHAAVVGALIEARTAGDALASTPRLAALPAFGRKLCAASTRKRKSDACIVWTVERREAEAGFHYLILFRWSGVPKSFLTTEEAHAVHEVLLTLKTALVARKGAKELDRAVIERQLEAWQQPPTSDDAPVNPPDAGWMRRLRRRVAQEDALGATPLNRIPPHILRLLAPPNIYR